MRSRRRHRVLHRAPGLALVLVVVFLLGQLGSVVHNALVEHATCEEHGEQVHTSGHGHAAAVVVVESTGDARVRSRPERASGDEHDHCVICSIARERWSHGSTPLLAALPPLAHTSVTLPPARDVACAGAPYRYAPKQSPPA